MRYLVIAILLAVPAFADGPEFEAAAIKPFVRPQTGRWGNVSGGPGTTDPTHITLPGGSLKRLLSMAFGFQPYQVIGPDSLDSDLFEFAIATPEGATRDDIKIMWRNLLVSRFGLKYHIEQREFPVDDLVIGPKGHKLTENTDPAPQPNADGTFPPPTPPKIENGTVTLNSAAIVTMTKVTPNGIASTIFAKGQTIGGLISLLSNELSHPVIDKTNLAGKYDFTFEFQPDSPASAAMVAKNRSEHPAAPSSTPAPATDLVPNLNDALQQQLGLRLAKGKSMLDVVVVDKINRTPTEN